MIDGSLFNMDIAKLGEVLSLFIMEIRKWNGEEYQRETLYKIVLSLKHFISMNGRNIKLLDHPGLVSMRNTLDNQMKQLSKQGVVHKHSQAKAITLQEDHMWKSDLLGNDTPEKLFNTLLYLIGIHFTLRACEEYKLLKTRAFGQLKLKVDYDTNRRYLEYTEHHSRS